METFTPNAQDARTALTTLLRYIGEDPEREGLKETPDRILRMFKEIFRGYNPDKKPKITTFDNEDGLTDLVFDSGDYYSMCEHHILPFFGKYYFAYIPSQTGRILGISKVARVVGYCAARLQLQERLAMQIVDMLSTALDGQHNGMAIVMNGTHLCKTMRGVKNNGKMSVAHYTGLFKHSLELRNQFLDLIKLQNG
ncbi:MAG: GTP cyclohydrolase I [Prevotella sp.]|nr:GTP cyclohydrolase I [Lachnospiraceae bacterium]MCM1379553.1 GTP cyclohydrolase I [Bacteroides sp.]MCM1445845.1 GTP cyclohydrolase I [Prevotella sp.]